MDAQSAPKRLESLDVFRGITIAGMILVNSPGNDHAYRAVRHADWHGWTPADFVFPSFLFIMGASMAISLGRRLDRGESPARLLRQVLWRTGVIFSLGLIINVFDSGSLEGFRVMGVMQRISLCYLVSCLFFLQSGPRIQAAAAAAFLLGYWALMTLLPVPGFGASQFTLEGNLASYLDKLLLGRHMGSATHDQEGILSTIPALASALAGVLAGQWVRSHRTHARKSATLLACGAVCILLGGLWGAIFPINKHIWTSSYALFTSGIALGVFAMCYGAIEILDWKAWGKPFQVFGRNPLLSYFLSGLFYGVMEFVTMTLPNGLPGNLKSWLCEKFFGSWMTPPDASLMFTLIYIGFCFALMSVLYRKKVFLKI